MMMTQIKATQFLLQTFKVTTEQGGTTTDNSGSTVTYTPPNEFASPPSDEFEYDITDEHGATATCTVSIEVENTPPDCGDDSTNTDAATPINIPVFANDNDPDGDALTISSLSAPTGGGSATTQGTQIRYDPGGFVGTATFSYTVSDSRGAESDPCTVTITVDPLLPIAVASASPTSVDCVSEDSDDGEGLVPSDLVTLTGAGSRDQDEGGASITSYQWTRSPATGTFNFDSTTGAGTFTPQCPAAGSTTTYTLTLIVTDDESQRSEPDTVEVTVTSPLQRPVADDIDVTIAVRCDTCLETRSIVITLTGNDPDSPDPDQLTYVKTSNPSIGSVSEPTPTTPATSAEVTYSIDLDYNNLQVCTAEAPDSTSFEYLVRDNSGLESEPAVVTINFDCVNTPPEVDASATPVVGTTFGLSMAPSG